MSPTDQTILSRAEIEDIATTAAEHAVRRTLKAMGYPEDLHEAQQDVLFMSRWRRMVEGAAQKIGMTVIGAIVMFLVAAAGIGSVWMALRQVAGGNP